MKRDQRLTNDLIKSRIRRVNTKCGFLSSGSSCFFQLFLKFSLVLDPRGILGGKVGNSYEEFEDNEGGTLG